MEPDSTCHAIYIIEIPVGVSVEGVGPSDGFRVVQVGKVSPSLEQEPKKNKAKKSKSKESAPSTSEPSTPSMQASTLSGIAQLKKRLYAHYGAWHYATGATNTFSKSKATDEDFEVAHIAEFKSIVGVIVRPAVDNEAIEDVESFVRENVGVKLRTSLMKKLLTQPFVSSELAGMSILKKGRHFSTSELRLVSTNEVRSLLLDDTRR